jgi:hypothetical protein
MFGFHGYRLKIRELYTSIRPSAAAGRRLRPNGNENGIAMAIPLVRRE